MPPVPPCGFESGSRTTGIVARDSPVRHALALLFQGRDQLVEIAEDPSFADPGPARRSGSCAKSPTTTVIFEEISGIVGIGSASVGPPAKAMLDRHDTRAVAPQRPEILVMTSPDWKRAKGLDENDVTIL